MPGDLIPPHLCCVVHVQVLELSVLKLSPCILHLSVCVCVCVFVCLFVRLLPSFLACLSMQGLDCPAFNRAKLWFLCESAQPSKNVRLGVSTRGPLLASFYWFPFIPTHKRVLFKKYTAIWLSTPKARLPPAIAPFPPAHRALRPMSQNTNLI